MPLAVKRKDQENDEQASGIDDIEEDGDEEECEGNFFINARREIDNTSPLDEVLITGENSSLLSGTVPLLVIMSLIAINADLSDDPTKQEPESVLVSTCTFLMKKLHNINLKKQQDESVFVDSSGMDALTRALLTRVGALSSNKKYKLGRCTNVLSPPETKVRSCHLQLPRRC